MSLINAPRWVVLQVTELCNLRCHMCYEWGDCGIYKKNKEYNTLPIDTIENVFSDLSPFKPQFELFGGEPLMHPQFDKIIELINKYNCNISIPTNGTLVSKYSDLIASSSINNLWISIDGPHQYNDAQRGKGVYDLALNGLYDLYRKKKIIGNGPDLGVTMVVTPQNYDKVTEFFCNELDINAVDKISIEIQLFITQEQNNRFKTKLQDQFGIHNTHMSDGLIRELSDFNNIDIEEMCNQVNYVRNYYRTCGKTVIGYPKYYEYENMKLFYSGKWNQMKEKKRRCAVPLIYAEIGADGYVTPCHTFYEFKMGNVNEESILNIWRNKQYLIQRQELSKNVMPICYACSIYFD